MIVLSAVFWVLSLLLTQVKCGKYDCFINASNGNQYNLTNLKKDGGWALRDVTDGPDDIIKNYYKFNLCEDIPTNCTTPSQVAAYHEAFFGNVSLGFCTSYGSADNVSVQPSNLPNGNAINVTYLQGDQCMYVEGFNFESRSRKSTFLIYCGDDSKASWSQSKTDGKEITACSPQFVIYHPAGCPVNQTGGVFWKIIKYLFYALVILVCLAFLYRWCLQNKSLESRHFGWWKSITNTFSACIQGVKAKMVRLFSKVRKSGGNKREMPSPTPVKYEVI